MTMQRLDVHRTHLRRLQTEMLALLESAAEGDFSGRLPVREEHGLERDLAVAFNHLFAQLEDQTHDDWQKTHLLHLARTLCSERTISSLCARVLSHLASAVHAQQGTICVAEDLVLRLVATYGVSMSDRRYGFGEGLVGQAARDKRTIVLSNVPREYFPIASSLGTLAPASIVIIPIVYEDEVFAVIELASLHALEKHEIDLLERVGTTIGAAIRSLRTRMHLEERVEKLEAAKLVLEERVRELELVSKNKSDFLANVSHELRTPLNSLLILAQLLADNEERNLTPKQIDYVKTIGAAGTDLLALINQILDLSKIEAGKLHVEIGTVELAQLLSYVQTTFAHVAHRKGIDMSVYIAPDVPRVIVTDEQRVRQILKNLLSNAFKFTEHGRVDVRIELVRDRITFAVTDTGIGIPLEKHEAIFEPFQQAETSTSRMYGGTGLGLTISRDLARLLGGTITVSSALAKGSTFTLDLPLSRGPSDHVPVTAEKQKSTPDLVGRRVLVVDDDEVNLYAVRNLLERSRMNVLAASSATQAFDLLEQHSVDIVLMDMTLPDVDGCEATRKIRGMPRHANVPIVAVTAHAMPSQRDRCLRAGCNDFVAKPVDGERLVWAIEGVLR